MSNLIEETKLLEYNKRDLVEALNGIGISCDMETPLSRLAFLLQWASGLGGVFLCADRVADGQECYISQEEWDSMSSNQKGDYNTKGVLLMAEGRAIIIAKENCLSPTGTGSMHWAEEQYDVPGLKNYSDTGTTTGFLSDFNGEGKTDLVLQVAENRSAVYTAPVQARAYKAYSGDTTKWSIGDVSEWSLVFRYRTQVSEALTHYFGVGLAWVQYWTIDEYSSIGAWYIQSSGALYYGINKNNVNYCVRPFARPSAIS